MSSYISALFKRTESYDPLVWETDRNCVKVTETKKNDTGVVAAFNRMWGRSKGVADLFGLIHRSTDFAALQLPAQWTSWNEQVGLTFKQSRNALAVPYFATTLEKAVKSGDYRDGLEAIAMGQYAATNFLPKELAKTVGASGSVFKTVLDVVDCKRDFENYQKYSQLVLEAEKPNSHASDQVKSGLSNLLKETGYKVVKCFLGFLTGIVGIASYIFGVVLPPPVMVAALVATLGGIIISIITDFTHETAPFHAKVESLAQKQVEPLSQKKSGLTHKT